MEQNKTNKNTKKVYQKVSVRHSAEIAVMYQKCNIKIKEIVKNYPQYSVRSIYRHAKICIGSEPPQDKRKFNKGRPQMLSIREKRHLLRAIKELRIKEGNFTSKRLAVEAGLYNKVCNRTIRKYLNKAGYFYLQARKKGLMSPKDLKRRVKFCRKIIRRKLSMNFWTTGIGFYLDGKGFAYKNNPQDQARAPRARVWRKRGEGLDMGCTAKAGKAGVTNLNFFIAISHKKGVVLCERYHGRITGQKFANVVKEHFPTAFSKCSNPRGKRFLQDGCPRQNSAVARKAIDDVNGKIFRIPARSPDLNPIENFFNLVTQKLHSDAIKKNITKETKNEFEQRIRDTVMGFSKNTINKIIETMPKRVKLILKYKGKRLKY